MMCKKETNLQEQLIKAEEWYQQVYMEYHGPMGGGALCTKYDLMYAEDEVKRIKKEIANADAQ